MAGRDTEVPGATSETIYHITPRSAWEAAEAAGTYRADSLESQGYIHCSTAGQVRRVAETWFAGQKGLCLLVIDSSRLVSEIRWEPGSDKPDELFPHLYGELDLDAVIEVLELEPGPGWIDHPPAGDGRDRSGRAERTTAGDGTPIRWPADPPRR